MRSRFLKGMCLSLATAVSMNTAFASQETIVCENEIQAEAKTDKKKLKTFTLDFWKAFESRVAKYPKSLESKGVVVGDFHFSNLGIYFDPTIDRTRLTLNDLDDSGEHYLIGDFLKYLIFLSSLKRNLDYSKIIDAYQSGLVRQSMSIPFEIKELLGMKAPDFQKKSAKYVNRKRVEAELYDQRNLTSEQRKYFEEFEKMPFFRDLTSVERWFQVNTSGSSVGMARYSYVAANKQTGMFGSFEFKELRCSATGNHEKQNLKENYKKVTQYLNQLNGVQEKDSFISKQKIVYVGKKFFLLREKFPQYMKDLEIESLRAAKLQGFAEYYAFYLGFIHSGSASKEFKESLSSNKNFLLEEMKELYAEFKKRLGNEN